VKIPAYKCKLSSVKALLVICLFLLVFNVPAAGDVEELTPERTLNIRRVSDLHLSPDGRFLAFSLSEPVKVTERNQDIWILDLASKESRRFTTSEKADFHPRWSPDGKSLAFLSSREENAQVYLIEMEGGEARVLTMEKTAVTSFAWSPDGSRLAFTAKENKSAEEKKKIESKDDARVVGVEGPPARLWVMELESGSKKILVGGDWRIDEYVWELGGRGLIVSASQNPQKELFTKAIYRVGLEEARMDQVFSPPGPYGNLKVSPDGRILLYCGARQDGPSPFDLWAYEFESRRCRNLTADSVDRSIVDFQWRTDGSLMIQAPDGFVNGFIHLRQDGSVVGTARFTVNPARSFVETEGRLIFIGENSVRPPEIWVSDASARVEKLTDFNPGWPELGLVTPKIVKYPSFDGRAIEAAIFMPKGIGSETPLPFVVLVHGGPSGAWTDRFNSWAQLLAARGIGVLCPNIRGSIGYGFDFMASNRKDWGGGDYKDVMAGIDHLVEKGIADPERLGIGGWSYGGYMAAWAVTQTDRFRAAVSGAPMTDLAVEYGTESASINAYDTWYMGTPYEDLDLFLSRSPMTFVNRVRSPTLLLCGENDITDPIAQCFMFYRGLRRAGVESEFVAYPREGHGIREEMHQLDLLRRMLRWFERYLKAPNPSAGGIPSGNNLIDSKD